MIEKIQKDELTFNKKEEFLNFYNNREVDFCAVPSSNLKLDTNFNLNYDGQTFPLTSTGIDSLLKQVEITEQYAYKVCDPDLLTYSVNNILSRSKEIFLIKLVNGKVSLISCDMSKMIDDKLIVDSISDILGEIYHVDKSDGYLRITFLKDFETEIKEGDIIKGGYEILNYENKQNGLSVSLFFLREVCSNGLVSTEPVEQFHFSSTNDSILNILSKFRSRISNYQDVLNYASAFSFSLQNNISNHLESLKDYLRKFSGKGFFEDNFSDFTENTSWFEVINRITNSAKINQIERKRDFEMVAGSLLETFFHKNNYPKYLFRKNICRNCPVLN